MNADKRGLEEFSYQRLSAFIRGMIFLLENRGLGAEV